MSFRSGCRLFSSIIFKNTGLEAVTTRNVLPVQRLQDIRPVRQSSSKAEGDINVTDSENTSKDKDDNEVLIEKLENQHIMTIGINRPDKRNCVNDETAHKLYEAFMDFENDDEMYCAVLHGLGGNFCAGYDLKELASIEDDELANRVAAMMDRGPMGPTRMDLRKPTIAAIDGFCVAGGLELALMCDLRVAEETSKLGVLNRRFGVPLIDGGSVRLPELIGVSRAMDLILTGRLVEPKEAEHFGLVNRVVSTGTAYGQAMNLAKEIVKFPQVCLRADRASLLYATFSARNIDEAFQYESDNALQVISKEAIDGARKFMKGLGKHGKFNVSQVSEPQQWQKEFEEMKKEKKDD